MRDDGKIKIMWRIKKLCIYLDEYVKTRSLAGLTLEFQQILRSGITEDKLKEFGEYIEKKGEKSIGKIDIDEVSDLVKRDFFETQTHQIYTDTKLIRVGWKGRKLTQGSRIDRFVYFWEYAFADTPYLVGLIGGVGFLAILFLLLQQIFIKIFALVVYYYTLIK